MHKSKNKVRVRFVGNNSENVTGSCVLIETETKKILVECDKHSRNKSVVYFTVGLALYLNRA